MAIAQVRHPVTVHYVHPLLAFTVYPSLQAVQVLSAVQEALSLQFSSQLKQASVFKKKPVLQRIALVTSSVLQAIIMFKKLIKNVFFIKLT